MELEGHNDTLGQEAASATPTTTITAEPPSLEYSLYTPYSRRWRIAFFWTLVVFDSTIMPIALYYGLWYGTDLSPNTVFSIVTAALGGISILEYVLRFWHLWKKGSTCRVIGGRRKYLDWFHWCFSAMWIVIMAELIVGTVFENPPIRLLAMPLATVLFTFGTELLIIDILRIRHIPSPIRISSSPAGAPFRPGIYSIIEDVIAVDGGGGTVFRERLNTRYEASHIFRQMLHRLTLFWAIGAEVMAVVTTILVFTLQRDAAYTVGWSVPFIWAGVWVLGTWWYVEKDLKLERQRWGEEEVKAAV